MIVPRNQIESINFAGAHISLIREEEVREHLSLDRGIDDLREALRAQARQQAVNCVRVRVQRRDSDHAWLHTLRAGMNTWDVVGGKDYTSIGFKTPAMWVTVVDGRTGLPVALIEADYLSRVRTAAVTAIATDLLAPAGVTCLAHFGAGKISELLVRAVLKVRPSVRRVLLVRHDFSKEPPDWLNKLGGQVQGEIIDIATALSQADLVTTATNSRTPVIPSDAAMPGVRHLNLIGANHIKRREIPDDLIYRCLPPRGYLVVEDTRQAQLEAGDFAAVDSEILNWEDVPTLGRLIEDHTEQEKAEKATLTVFKSVGIGLMDLALGTGVVRRMGLLGSPPFASNAARLK